MNVAVTWPAAEQTGAPPLKRQQIVDASEAVTVNDELLLAVVEPWAGPAMMATVGRMVSTVQVWITLAPLPEKSAALTSRVCRPWPRPLIDGAATVAPAAEQLSAPLSNFQQIVDASEAATLKLAVVELTVEPGAGPAVMATVGRTVSTMKLRVVEAPTPTRSRA